jgi:hypothetical protein
MLHEKQTHRIASMVLAGLVGAPGMAPPAPEASKMATVSEDDPAWIVVSRDPAEYPDPICLGCKVVAKTTKATSSDETDAGRAVTLTYLDEDHPTFVGDVVLTIFLLDAEEPRTVVIDDVALSNDRTFECIVSEGLDWTWDEVEVVWAELVPAA